jgi:hypothetical protein
MTAQFEEKRQHERVKGDIAVAVNDTEANIITEAKDISCSGVCCKTNKIVPMMTQVVITLLVPHILKGEKTIKKIKCQGVVVRHERLKDDPGMYEMAIFFTKLSKQDKNILVDYVDYMKAKDNVAKEN